LESISPDDVLNHYKKIRGDVKSFSSVENIRNDIIGGCNSKLLVMIKKLGALEDDQLANLKQYIKDIPRDSASAILMQMAASDDYSQEEVFKKLMVQLGKDHDLYVYILEANSKIEAEREKKKEKEKEKAAKKK
jgi:hypothetical protein